MLHGHVRLGINSPIRINRRISKKKKESYLQVLPEIDPEFEMNTQGHHVDVSSVYIFSLEGIIAN